MPQVSASGLPDQMSRHGLPEGIVFVGHNNLGLATNEELTRAAVNGTLLDGDSMEPTRYPWLTGKYTGPAAEPVVHVIGSRRAVPLPYSPGANSPSPRANLLYPEAASQLTNVPGSCLSPDATISDTSGSPAPSVDFEVLSRALGAVSTPVHSPSPVTTDQLGITAQAAQSSAAQLDCSESLEKQSPTPSSPTQALTASAPDSAADSALNMASEALPIGVLFQKAQLPRASTAADNRLRTLPGTPAHSTPEALQPALTPAQAQRGPLEGLVASAAEALLSGSQAVKQQQSSRAPEPVALEARKERVSSGPAQTVHEGALLAASALAGMADSHFEEGSDNAEDVSLIEIKHRLQSMIAQLDNHPALAMEQHRTEPGSSDMDMHADDSAHRSEVADTHGDFDKQYVAGNMPAATYKASSSWAVASSPHQLPAGDQLGSHADPPKGAKPPSNGASHGLPTPPTRWVSIPKDHFDSLAAKLLKIELETTIQQLQHELKAVRQQQASQVSSLEVQLEAAQSRAARVEAAQEHAVQQQFADDCLKKSEG
ncbi:hypothetical protein WJX82_003484 [Trebouxia sp. C0006]